MYNNYSEPIRILLCGSNSPHSPILLFLLFVLLLLLFLQQQTWNCYFVASLRFGGRKRNRQTDTQTGK